jgi:hypothetical protein
VFPTDAVDGGCFVDRPRLPSSFEGDEFDDSDGEGIVWLRISREF